MARRSSCRPGQSSFRRRSVRQLCDCQIGSLELDRNHQIFPARHRRKSNQHFVRSRVKATRCSPLGPSVPENQVMRVFSLARVQATTVLAPDRLSPSDRFSAEAISEAKQRNGGALPRPLPLWNELSVFERSCHSASQRRVRVRRCPYSALRSGTLYFVPAFPEVSRWPC